MDANEDIVSNTGPFHGSRGEQIVRMRGGTPATVITDLAARFELSQDSLFKLLRLPPSTLKGRIGKNTVLSSSEQDRMYRADRIWSRALEVFEDEANTRVWIKTHNRALGGEAPLALLDTEAGYELVLDTLAHIEYGVIS
jgi:putative toxin-antitoxin system antitoxin component (TIGR02293 family)